MKDIALQLHPLRTGYLVSVLVVMGLCAAVSAVLIAWPALAYLGAKLV